MSFDGSRSALAASRPGAPLAAPSARSTGGNGSSGPSQGTMRAACSTFAQRAEDVAGMQAVAAGHTVSEEKPQRLADGREGDVVPRYLMLFEEPHFQAFFAGFDVD